MSAEIQTIKLLSKANRITAETIDVAAIKSMLADNR
jgi:hypothetical protein